MTFEQLLDYMYENHRIRRQKDMAQYFGVTTQAVSNWKRTNTIPAKYAIKLQMQQPVNNAALLESLTNALISLNDNIQDIKTLQDISNLGAHWFADGEFGIVNNKPFIKLVHLKGKWEELIGYTNEEILSMDNILATFQDMSEEEYRTRLQPTGLTEATYAGYWDYKHKNGYKFKVKGKSWVDFVNQSFKSAITLYDK
ncbi:MAG: helix-turn-helix domain-containing protein [Candidatus Marinimicrobia bacterium]|nr:helix-turn-helix domain-containing protein [Candidatus Neomarinimicrobiota bacterium]